MSELNKKLFESLAKMSNENCCYKVNGKNCCEQNSSKAENCCCKVCGDENMKCYYKEMFGLCRKDVPCYKGPRQRPAKFVSGYRHKNN